MSSPIKIFVVKDALRTGKIVEAEAHRLTGHPNWVRVSGLKKTNLVLKDNEWFLTLEAAQEYMAVYVKKHIAYLEGELERTRKRLVLDVEYLEKVKVAAKFWR